MALGSISFGQGVSSGIDWKAMTDAIINADSVPITNLKNEIADFSSAKNAFGAVSSSLADLKAKLQAMHDGTAIGGKTATVAGLASGATAPFSAKAGSAAMAGSYDVNVIDLAAAKRVRSNGLDDANAPLVADGTITIKSGSNDAITIDVSAASGNNSLQSVADAINSADKGVSAGVVSDGSKWLLVVKSKETGTDHDLAITDTTNLGLADTGNVLQDAKNAKVDIDGITITSQGNTIDNALDGVSLTLAAKTASPVTLQVADDVDGTKQALRDFVTAYNKVNDLFQSQLGSAAAQKSSTVASNSVFRNIQSQLVAQLTDTVSGVADGHVHSLAELGVRITDGTGKIEFNESTFDDIVSQGRFDEVKSVLQSAGSTSDTQVAFMTASSTAKAGTYAVHVTTAAKQATLEGSAAIGNAGLAGAETLTITLGATSRSVDLLAGDTIDAVVSKVNAAMKNAGLGVIADSDGGKLRLRSSEFGSDQSISAVSTVADAGDGSSTGIGTTLLANTGVDVAGTIAGVAATGHGRDLTAADSSDAAGISVRVYGTDASVAAKGGDFGTVGYSAGISDQFLAQIKALTDPLSGTIKSATDGFDRSIKTDNDRIASIQANLDAKRELLTKQFAAAESAISQLNQMMSSMNAQQKA